MTFLLLIGMVLVIIWEVFHGRISLNLGLLLLLVNFIRHHKYHVKPHSSPWWFSAACAPSIAHRTQFFHLYQQNKSSESKLNFRQASNCCKRVFESAKLAYTTKTKESMTSQKLGSRVFGELVIVFSTKVNLLYLLYSMDRMCYLMHLIKQNYLLTLRTFPRNLILTNLVSLYLFSLLELIWNCIIFP